MQQLMEVMYALRADIKTALTHEFAYSMMASCLPADVCF